MRIFFTATTGRTGTTGLADLFRFNVRDCIARHEPAYKPAGLFDKLYFSILIPQAGRLERRGFGRALQWHDRDSPQLTRLVRYRARCIRRFGCEVYLESSHAFLSSLGEAYLREFPDPGLIHLTRHPLEVAVSYCHRNRVPVDSPRFLQVFSLWHPHPDSHKNCLKPPAGRLNCLQYYLWAWIESELRFLRFIENHPAVRYFDLDTTELNNAECIANMFQFFELETHVAMPVLPSVSNKNRQETIVTAAARESAYDLLRRMDVGVLERLPRPYDLLMLREG